MGNAETGEIEVIVPQLQEKRSRSKFDQLLMVAKTTPAAALVVSLGLIMACGGTKETGQPTVESPFVPTTATARTIEPTLIKTTEATPFQEISHSRFNNVIERLNHSSIISEDQKTNLYVQITDLDRADKVMGEFDQAFQEEKENIFASQKAKLGNTDLTPFYPGLTKEQAQETWIMDHLPAFLSSEDRELVNDGIEELKNAANDKLLSELVSLHDNFFTPQRFDYLEVGTAKPGKLTVVAQPTDPDIGEFYSPEQGIEMIEEAMADLPLVSDFKVVSTPNTNKPTVEDGVPTSYVGRVNDKPEIRAYLYHEYLHTFDIGRAENQKIFSKLPAVQQVRLWSIREQMLADAGVGRNYPSLIKLTESIMGYLKASSKLYDQTVTVSPRELGTATSSMPNTLWQDMEGQRGDTSAPIGEFLRDGDLRTKAKVQEIPSDTGNQPVYQNWEEFEADEQVHQFLVGLGQRNKYWQPIVDHLDQNPAVFDDFFKQAGLSSAQQYYAALSALGPQMYADAIYNDEHSFTDLLDEQAKRDETNNILKRIDAADLEQAAWVFGVGMELESEGRLNPGVPYFNDYIEALKVVPQS